MAETIGERMSLVSLLLKQAIKNNDAKATRELQEEIAKLGRLVMQQHK